MIQFFDFNIQNTIYEALKEICIVVKLYLYPLLFAVET